MPVEQNPASTSWYNQNKINISCSRLHPSSLKQLSLNLKHSRLLAIIIYTEGGWGLISSLMKSVLNTFHLMFHKKIKQVRNHHCWWLQCISEGVLCYCPTFLSTTISCLISAVFQLCSSPNENSPLSLSIQEVTGWSDGICIYTTCWAETDISLSI